MKVPLCGSRVASATPRASRPSTILINSTIGSRRLGAPGGWDGDTGGAGGLARRQRPFGTAGAAVARQDNAVAACCQRRACRPNLITTCP
ncbi:MAG: hypothetical protein MZW92_65850 [Comamonadaceae bacterium]|nr:hypothetical protein [Comamonadaceae bacterium]